MLVTVTLSFWWDTNDRCVPFPPATPASRVETMRRKKLVALRFARVPRGHHKAVVCGVWSPWEKVGHEV